MVLYFIWGRGSYFLLQYVSFVFFSTRIFLSQLSLVHFRTSYAVPSTQLYTWQTDISRCWISCWEQSVTTCHFGTIPTDFRLKPILFVCSCPSWCVVPYSCDFCFRPAVVSCVSPLAKWLAGKIYSRDGFCVKVLQRVIYRSGLLCVFSVTLLSLSLLSLF